MLNDFDPIVLDFPDGEDIKIYGVSCLHKGAREHKQQEWDRFMRKFIQEPRSYLILLGDLMNNNLKNSVGSVYEDVIPPREQKQWLIDEFRPVREKILAIVPGNHEGRSQKEVDNNPLWDVAYKLDLENRFRPNMVFLALRFGDIKRSGLKNPSYTIGALHGAGGGSLSGAVLNRNERFAYGFEGLDILMVGHSSKNINSKAGKLVFDARNKKVSEKAVLVVAVGSWTANGGYGLRGQMLPTAHAIQEIHLSGQFKEARVLLR